MSAPNDTANRSKFHVEEVDPADLVALNEIEEVQVAAWEDLPEREIVPSHVLMTIAETGGQLLAARADDTNRIIGFTLAFLARNDGPKKHKGIPDGELFFASHLAAVLPAHQGGVGYELKQAQRLDSLRRGIRWVQWTYYPMLTKNASLNLRKLGARCYKFVENKYGGLGGRIYEGLPTDRLVVLWDLAGREQAQFPDDAVALVRRGEGGRPVLDEPALLRAAGVGGPDSVICPVPSRFEELRQTDLEAARAWQVTFARVATTLLTPQANWSIANFRLSEDRSQGEYLFVRG